MPIRRKVIKFSREDLKRCYSWSRGCSIFSAFQRAGVPVKLVDWDRWEDEGGKYHNFSKSLQRVSDLLCEKRLPEDRKSLLGKRFVVRW